MRYSFILGAPKSGTTSVARSLNSYEIDLPDRKEIMYFDVNYSKGQDWYKRHANGEILLDGTPTYLSNPTALARVLHFAKTNECSFVVILRNPIDRYWSHVNDLISWGVLTESDIENDPFHKCYLRRGKGLLEMSPYMYSCYSNSLRMLNRSGVRYLLIDFDELRQPGTLQDISNELLGVSYSNDISLEHHHSSFEWRSKKIARVLNSEILRNIYSFIPNKNFQQKVKTLYYRFQNYNYNDKPKKYFDTNINDIVKRSLLLENSDLYSEINRNENLIGKFQWSKPYI